MAKSRGQRCGDIELVSYLTYTTGPFPLVLDLSIGHQRWGSTSNPCLNSQLHYPRPDNIDRPLNEETDDKILDYRDDYKNRPSNAISFMSDVARSSGPLHCVLVRILFLQTHRETDRFFAASGVQLT